jgi:hypothetical protein
LGLLIGKKESVSGDVEDARRPGSFERCFGSLLLQEERCLGQDGLDRQGFTLRPRQRPENDLPRLPRIALSSGSPDGWRIAGPLICARGDGCRFTEERIGDNQRNALARR